jgi:hypothetical protein
MLKTTSLAVTILLCNSVPLLHAQSYKRVQLHFCARADSTLPPSSDALKGHVRASYNGSIDSTRLTAGNARGATVDAKMAGHGPAPAPVAQLTILLGNVEAEMVRRGEQPPVVTLTTDDSVTQELSPIQIGRFVARGGTPPPRIIRIPLSAELDDVNLIAIARARDVVLHVSAVTIQISDDDRRDIAGLYVAMVCGT